MRIFLAGATGVIGIRLIPPMLADGHVVAAMTRTPAKTQGLRAAGVTPILCDVFDRQAVVAAVRDFHPDLIVHQVTDLPDEFDVGVQRVAQYAIDRSEIFAQHRLKQGNGHGGGRKTRSATYSS